MPASDGRPLRRRVPRQGTRTCPVRVKRPQTAIDAASGAPISARDRVKLFLANAEYRGVPDVRVSEGPSHLRCAERTCRLADCWNAERLTMRPLRSLDGASGLNARAYFPPKEKPRQFPGEARIGHEGPKNAAAAIGVSMPKGKTPPETDGASQNEIRRKRPRRESAALSCAIRARQ